LSGTWADAPDVDAKSATLLAVKNALTLGTGLLFTWSIALGIRVILPRHLGPSLFGTLQFADAFASTFFVLVSLGMETYIRKEVAVRPEHASDFYGGAVVVRTFLTVGLIAAMMLVLWSTGRLAELGVVVFLYALTQFMVTANSTLSAMLHSKGRVRGMTALSVVTKVVWAGGVLWAIATGAGLWAYAAAYLASESIEVVALTWLTRQHLGLVFRVDTTATKVMLVASMPYFVNAIATTAYSKLDMSVLEFMAGSKEVGLYGAASTIAGLTLLISPIIGWVAIPMLSRAASRSRAELFFHVCRSTELILTIAIPASLLINLGADVWTRFIFGAQYAKAAAALRVMSTMFVLTYVSMIYAITLMMLERAWTLARITFSGLFVNVALNLLFVRCSVRWLGEGGGGTGCALAMLCTEIFVTGSMAINIGRGALDRRGASMIGRSLAAYAVVVGAHFLLGALGPARLVIDGLLYFGLAIAFGALRPKDMLTTVREAMRRPTPEASPSQTSA
jgi:O-antigen/teichoic acid export membrane protein